MSAMPSCFVGILTGLGTLRVKMFGPHVARFLAAPRSKLKYFLAVIHCKIDAVCARKEREVPYQLNEGYAGIIFLRTCNGTSLVHKEAKPAFGDEQLVSVETYCVQVFSGSFMGSITTFVKDIITLGMGDDIEHWWTVIETTSAYYAVQFGGNQDVFALSGCLSGCGSGSEGPVKTLRKGKLEMHRFVKKDDCHHFGLSWTPGLNTQVHKHSKFSGPVGRKVLLRNILSWIRNWDVDYNMLNNNCQHFCRATFQQLSGVSSHEPA